MKKQNKTKITLKKIKVARLDKQAKQAINGGTSDSFFVCPDEDTGSIRTAVIICLETRECLSGIINDPVLCGDSETLVMC